MKVVVNNQTNLRVEDQEGNVLFQWLPKKHTGGFVSTINIEPIDNKDMNDFADKLMKKLRMSMGVSEQLVTAHKGESLASSK